MVSGKPGVPHPTFLCVASLSPRSLCHSGQRWLLSTKSRAVPAEGVAPLTLHKPMTCSLPAFRERISAWLLLRGSNREGFMPHYCKNLEIRAKETEFVAKEKISPPPKKGLGILPWMEAG